MREKIITEIVYLGIIILVGWTIKETIKKEYPQVYKSAIKNMPWYLKWMWRI